MATKHCSQCSKTFGSSQSLQQHLSSPVHQNHECHTCDRIFRSQQALAQHLSSPAHVIKCNICNRRFGSQRALEQHIASQHRYECPFCDWIFRSDNALQQHIRSSRHGNFCRTCGRIFGSEQALQQHSTAVHYTHYCHCGLSFESRQALAQHEHRAHPPGLVPSVLSRERSIPLIAIPPLPDNAISPFEALNTTIPTEFDTPKCSICTDDIISSEVFRHLRCGHQFHESCINPWLQHNPSCPNCRTTVWRQGNPWAV